MQQAATESVMFELMKIVGLSAVLSAGVVTASEMGARPDQGAASGKIYQDRIPAGEPGPAQALRITYVAGNLDEGQGSQVWKGGKGDLLRNASQKACTSQAWPNIAAECLEAAGGMPVRSVRMITVEQREGANTSVLVRIPAAEIAQR
jgi:hypothetical protein